jgi:nucleoside-diphosphate-sugar epimerase
MAVGLAGRKVLVTGATGTIGRRLVVALLEAGADVSIITRSAAKLDQIPWHQKVSHHKADLTAPGSLFGTLDGIELVFHLASHNPGLDEAKLYEAPGHWSVTADGTKSLIAEGVRAGVRGIIYPSTVKAMGEEVGSHGRPADERCAAEPQTLYGRAKLAAEEALLDAGQRHGLHVCILRLPMVYGQEAGGNILRLIDAVARDRFPPWPRIENRRSAIHVDDVVSALLLAATSPCARGQIYLVSDGRAYSTRWLYEEVCQALGKTPPRWTIPLWLLAAVATAGSLIEHTTGRAMPLNRSSLGKLVGDAWLSSEKLRGDLGFQPTRTLQTTIAELVADYSRAA